MELKGLLGSTLGFHVFLAMFSNRHNLKVLRTVVRLDTVDMMDDFALLQQTPYHFLGHKAVPA
jgi:hypothetical protein